MTAALRLGPLLLGVLLLAAWYDTTRPDAGRFSYLSTRTIVVAVVLGWLAVGCLLVGGVVRRARPQAVAVVLGVAGLAVWGRLQVLDARDLPRINFGFVAGAGLSRLLLTVAGSLLVPAVIAAAIALRVRRT